jgi:hypothetical protein
MKSTSLSLFTLPNLDYLNSNAPSLKMSKTNTPFSAKDQVRLLNVVALLKACHREDMDRGQWQEVTRNWISFMGVVEGEDSAQQARWDNPFAYFEISVSCLQMVWRQEVIFWSLCFILT